MIKPYELMSVVTYTLSKLIPKKKNRWIFGSWFGDAATDNSRALFDYMVEHNPEIEKIWVLNEPEKHAIPGALIVKRNSLRSLRYILTAEVAVMNQGFGDFCATNFLGGCYKVQLWHGVAWKKIVRDSREKKSDIEDKIFNYINRYDLYIAPSEKYKEVVKSAFAAKEEQILLCGQPRNEVLFSESFIKKSRQEILYRTGHSDKKIVVYMPTFRDNTDAVFSFFKSEMVDKFSNLAQEYNFILIEKSHYKSTQNSCETKVAQDSYIFTMPTVDANTLLGAADILITDYSSCFFDFLIRNKPIIHYIYDYDYYKNKDRGLYYEIDEVAAGNIASNFDELLIALEATLKSEDAAIRYIRREQFITYEANNSSKKIFCHIRKKVE